MNLVHEPHKLRASWFLANSQRARPTCLPSAAARHKIATTSSRTVVVTMGGDVMAIGWKRLTLIAAITIAAVGSAASWITFEDYRANRAIEVVQSDTPNSAVTGEVELLKRLVRGESIATNDLAAVVAFVDARNDGSDFRTITLLRAAYAYGASFEPAVEETIRQLLLGFRYSMEEPGADPMIFWSENHQILFAASELLAAQRYPDATFADGRSGGEHYASARDRVLFWLEQRWRFGFSEWNSHYYGEDVAALSGLVDFVEDQEVAIKATMILDLLLLDIATHTFRGEFIATSGRLYENNKKLGDPAIRRLVRHAFVAPVSPDEATGIEINFLLSGYSVPAVLRAIAAGGDPTIITTGTGRELGELGLDPMLGDADKWALAAWGMESFTNPETIENSMHYIRARGLFANPALSPLRQLNYRVLLSLGALPLLSRTLDLPTNGIALTRADVYTLRTPDYMMSTTQAYRPGEYGNQEHVFGVTLDEGVTIFHTHPAVREGDANPNGNSPSYWTGYGRLPISCQDRSTNLSVYRVPRTPGFGRPYVLDFTHLYAPLSRFDRVVMEGNRLFLQYEDAFIAITAAGQLEKIGDSEIIQRGYDTFWVTEVSSLSVETLESFAARVRTAAIDFDSGHLSYNSGKGALAASFDSGCAIDAQPFGTFYMRHSSDYAQIEEGQAEYLVEHEGHTLVLNFDALKRSSQ